VAFSIRVAGKSDVGRKRSNNQDSILVSELHGLFAVADGMGGHSGGEVASAMAVKTLEKVFAESQVSDVPSRLHQAMLLANQVIYDYSQAHTQLAGMGTTLTAAAVDGTWLQIGQVGDSRLYLIKGDQIFQITEDHSQVYELLKAGLISEANMASVQRNVITRSVGYERQVSVDLFTRRMDVGDRYLICSDGLSGMVTNEQILQVVTNFELDRAVYNLVELANAQGGEDNISVVLFEVK
jgi:serine/threonine protein phosphatase PrpC